MRRTATSRFCGLVLALAFLVSAPGDVLGGHPCPHHDALPGATAEHDHAQDGAAPAGDDDSASPCTCIGSCSVSSGDAAPVIDQRTSAPAQRADYAVERSAPDVPRPRDAAYLLPFPNAPPPGHQAVTT